MMKKIMMCFSGLLLTAILLLSFAACSSGGSGGSETSETGADPTTPSESVDYDEADSTTYDEAAPTAADDGSGGAGLPDTNRKITFSASFTLETKAYDADYEKINQLVNKSGGYIAGEETQAYPYEDRLTTGRSSYFSVRVPVKGYDSFLTNLEKIGKVSNKNKSSEDLTASYFDTETRIEMLQLRKERLTGYIKSATKASDIVAFEKELSDVLLQLDKFEGNKRQLDQLIDYATVDVTLSELITPETLGQNGEPLGNRASNAFSMSVSGVGKFLQATVVFLAGAVPVIVLILILLIIIWGIVKLIRRLRRNYYEKHPEKKRKPQAGYIPYIHAGQTAPPPPQNPQAEPQPPKEGDRGDSA